MYNFGSVLDTMKEFVVNSVVDKTPLDKKKLGSALKLIKENQILRNQFKVYEDFRTYHSEDDLTISDFIAESIKPLANTPEKDIRSANNKFKKVVDELTNNKPIVESTVINTSISELVSGKRTADKVKAKSIIREHIKSNQPNEKLIEDYVPTDMLAKILVDRFNKKYEELSESDMAIIKSTLIADQDSRVSNFNTVVKECLDAVNTQLSSNDDVLKEKLLSVKERLLEMSYDSDNYENDMIKMITLKQSLI